MTRIRTCRTPDCHEWIDLGRLLGLCPSCRYVARRAFVAGSFVAGALSVLIPRLLEWFK